MLHLLYILAFTTLAVLAVANLIRSLITLSAESQKTFVPPAPGRKAAHPELLDAAGNYVNEPLLVMKSMTVEDAREQLNALYKASPSQNKDLYDEE